MTMPADPLVLVPGLACSARVWSPVLPALWRHGPVMIANHCRDDTMSAIAARILAEAPPRFALAGHSMGGYIAFEIMRQAPRRVTRLALLNSSARPDSPEATARREAQIVLAEAGRLHDVIEQLLPLFIHPDRLQEPALRDLVHAMADDVGPEGFVRHQRAIMSRPDSRPGLASIRCPVMVLASAQDDLLPVELSLEISTAIPGARLVLIPDCGHLSLPEHPTEVGRAMLDWLAG
jgi:pimeloyl-ACP methyl ester carboxylesterase